MDIYTSNYSKARHLDTSKFYCVSISRFPQRDYKNTACYELAPSKRLLLDYMDGLSQEEYTKRYRAEMAQIPDIHKVFERLALDANKRDIVLLCFESKGAFCHRHILSDIIFETYHYRIQEL